MVKAEEKEYRARIKRGIEKMKEINVAICMLVKNCEDTLPNNIQSIESLRTYFNQSYVVIIENNSTDKSKAILDAWKNKDKTVYVNSNDFIIDKSEKRTWREHLKYSYSIERISQMVTVRNLYLEYLKRNLEIDYLIVIDADLYKIDISGILNSFGFEKTWHCITSNGKRNTTRFPFIKCFYDAYAFKGINDNQPHSIIKLRQIQKKYMHLKKGMDFFQVRSGFGGAAIYKWEAVKFLYYRVSANNDKLIACQCEHVTLHADMIARNYDKIFLNPSQIIIYNPVNIKWYWNRLRIRLKRIRAFNY